MTDYELFKKATDRAKINGYYSSSESLDEVVIFLQKEIDQYCDKIDHMQVALNEKSDELKALKNFARDFSELELEEVRENATSEIIKALSDNGYDHITISAFKSEVTK